MTKRKATNSLDEWLTERRVVSEVPIPAAEIPSEPSIAAPPPTAEASQPQLTSNRYHVYQLRWTKRRRWQLNGFGPC